MRRHSQKSRFDNQIFIGVDEIKKAQRNRKDRVLKVNLNYK